MAWTDNTFVVATIVGGIIVIAFKFLSGNNNQQGRQQLGASSSRPGSVANANNNNNANQQRQQNTAVASHLPSQQLPSKNDDLPTLIKNGKAKNWKIVLHTRTNFEKIPTSALKNATKNHPHLLLVHQLFTESSEVSDVMAIKSNVDVEYFPRDRLVLCTTDKGPEAVARQHEPVMFVSDNKDLCKFLSAFLTFVVLVDPTAEKDIDIQYVSPSNVNAKSGPNKIYLVKNVEEVLK